ncbi:LysR family transcriptional regulator [Polynucleobacter sp. AP-RePozz3-80-G7]|uniref:LysR family transcriptional regulator n=1 Tax=Polynucleobacter sp. AP-RePozz3-80-G7 TaxID=2689105 RepID=UPI001C0B6F58|nr:LysR family transcriptional regulator [Polynucleobacter sp. AP-RePozz3-80-G7]MBU3638729.1 LysR family transcriptional regulator [Polynucleobacter sp. AP-RePozz3-80-G7]
MDKFQEITTFTAVVDAGSFVKAADRLGMSKAAVSRHLVDLETRLGIRLLHRTTRKLSLTEEGELFYGRCKEILETLESAENEITSHTDDVSGHIRINAPFSFGIRKLAPLWGIFHQKHPKVTLDVALSDRLVDVVDEGYDIAIRIAALTNSTMVSKKLTTTRIVLCASPTYLKQYGIPKKPADLVNHQVINYSYWAGKEEWSFDGPKGKESVNIKPFMQTNNGDTCLVAALAHQGIVLQPSFIVGDAIRAGDLVEIMPQYKSIELGIYALFPTRQHIAPKVRVLIDYLVEYFSKKDLDNF